MENLNIYLIRYYNNGYFCKSVVLAENYEKAESSLINVYKDFDVKIEIEEYEEITEKGIVLTECIEI